jgi:hypothetical protein
MKCVDCNWTLEKNARGDCRYYCEVCGEFSSTKPENFHDEVSDTEEESDEKCKHVWECLRDRCHNRGKGKYQAYKCKLCGKFQRR